jgi:hypothetical protein
MWSLVGGVGKSELALVFSWGEKGFGNWNRFWDISCADAKFFGGAGNLWLLVRKESE